MEEAEFKAAADKAVAELREFIDTENQMVKKEHELISEIESAITLISQLKEKIPEEISHLRDLNFKIGLKLDQINNSIQVGKFKGLRIEREEQHIAERLEEDISHRNWRAVKQDFDSEVEEEKKVLRLQKHELKELHKKFKELMKMIKKSKLKKAINEDLALPDQKKEYEQMEEYYFIQIYKFARAYQKIFKDLWKKEKKISKIIKANLKKISQKKSDKD